MQLSKHKPKCLLAYRALSYRAALRQVSADVKQHQLSAGNESRQIAHVWPAEPLCSLRLHAAEPEHSPRQPTRTPSYNSPHSLTRTGILGLLAAPVATFSTLRTISIESPTTRPNTTCLPSSLQTGLSESK